MKIKEKIEVEEFLLWKKKRLMTEYVGKCYAIG